MEEEARPYLSPQLILGSVNPSAGIMPKDAEAALVSYRCKGPEHQPMCDGHS